MRKSGISAAPTTFEDQTMITLNLEPTQERSTAVGALIYRPGLGLYIQKQAQDRGHFQDSWDMPKVTMAKHESVSDALARQVTGETGWTLKEVKALLGHRVWKDHELDPATWTQGWVDEYDFLVTVEEDAIAPCRQNPGQQNPGQQNPGQQNPGTANLHGQSSYRQASNGHRSNSNVPEIKGWQWLTRESLNELARSEKRHVHDMVKNAMDYLGL